MRKQTKEKIVIFCMIAIAILIISKVSYATDSELDIRKIIANNSQSIKKEEIITKEKDLEYTTKYLFLEQ